MELYVGIFILFVLVVVIPMMRLNEAMRRMDDLSNRLTDLKVKKNKLMNPTRWGITEG